MSQVLLPLLHQERKNMKLSLCTKNIYEQFKKLVPRKGSSNNLIKGPSLMNQG